MKRMEWHYDISKRRCANISGYRPIRMAHLKVSRASRPTMAGSWGSCRTPSARYASRSFLIGRSFAKNMSAPESHFQRKGQGFNFLEMQYNTFMANKPQVGILMGSDSDLPVMQEAAKALEEFGIGSEVHTLSAHRTTQAGCE